MISPGRTPMVNSGSRITAASRRPRHGTATTSSTGSRTGATTTAAAGQLTATATTARAAITAPTASHLTIRAATTGDRISEMAPTLHADREGGLPHIGRRLDDLPVGPVHRRVVIAIGLGLFFEVYEIFLSSTIATALQTQYGLGGTALQLLLASSFLGMFIGAVAFGRIADRIGRRRAFLISLVWFSVWSVIGAVAPNPWMLVGSRFMAGIGVGAECPGRRFVPVRRAPEGSSGAPGRLGLHLLLPCCSGAGIPVAVAQRSQPFRLRGLASPVVGRRNRRSVRHPAAPWPAGVAAVAGGRGSDRRRAGRIAGVRIRRGHAAITPLTAMKTMTSRPRRSRFGPRQRFNDCGFRPTGSG